MTRAYYPGCSMSGTERAYEGSLLAVSETLGTGLNELDDWNCCGASALASVDEDRAFALGARNLALTESRVQGEAPVDPVAARTGCYRALLEAERSMAEQQAVANRIDGALQAVGLRYDGRARVRHPIDMVVNDIGLERISRSGPRDPPGGGMKTLVTTARAAASIRPGFKGVRT